MATLTATPEPGNDPPRVLLQLSWPDLTSAQVTRRDPDGRDRPVRLGEPARLSGGEWVGYDYESPFGRPVTYKATSTAGVSVSSTAVMLDVTAVWLRHPGIPNLSLPLRVVDMGQQAYPVRRGVFTPLGRRMPIVVTDGRRQSPRSTLVVRTDTLTARQQMVSLLDDAAVLLLDIPPSKGWGVEHLYVSIGEAVEARRVEYGSNPERDWTLPYEETSRPIGGLTAERTFSDVLAEDATFQSVKDSYTSFRDLLLGRRRIPTGGTGEGTFPATFTDAF